MEENPETVAGGNKILKSEEQFLKGIYIAYPKSRTINAARAPVIPE